MENLIKNNKDKFMAELPSGHQERFAMKLEGRKLAALRKELNDLA